MLPVSGKPFCGLTGQHFHQYILSFWSKINTTHAYGILHQKKIPDLIEWRWSNGQTNPVFAVWFSKQPRVSLFRAYYYGG